MALTVTGALQKYEMHVKNSVLNNYVDTFWKLCNIGQQLSWKTDRKSCDLLNSNIASDFQWPLKVIAATENLFVQHENNIKIRIKSYTSNKTSYTYQNSWVIPVFTAVFQLKVCSRRIVQCHSWLSKLLIQKQMSWK